MVILYRKELIDMSDSPRKLPGLNLKITNTCPNWITEFYKMANKILSQPVVLKGFAKIVISIKDHNAHTLESGSLLPFRYTIVQHFILVIYK